MSFFISDSLKGIISEKDLEADSPIKIIEKKETLTIQFNNDVEESFELELISMNLCEVLDEINVATSKAYLSNIFNCHNKKVDFSICLNGVHYLKNSGTFVLDKLEVNKEDNCVVCKIDIFKRGL